MKGGYPILVARDNVADLPLANNVENIERGQVWVC